MQSGKDIMFLKHPTHKPHLRLASENDCIYLSENLREEDKQEIKAVTGLPPLLSLIPKILTSNIFSETQKMFVMFLKVNIKFYITM